MKTKSKLVLGLSILSAATLAAGATSTFAWYSVVAQGNALKASRLQVSTVENKPTITGLVFDLDVNIAPYFNDKGAVDSSTNPGTGDMELTTYIKKTAEQPTIEDSNAGTEDQFFFGYRLGSETTNHYRTNQFSTASPKHDFWRVYKVEVSVPSASQVIDGVTYTQQDVYNALSETAVKFDVTAIAEPSCAAQASATADQAKAYNLLHGTNYVAGNNLPAVEYASRAALYVAATPTTALEAIGDDLTWTPAGTQITLASNAKFNGTNKTEKLTYYYAMYVEGEASATDTSASAINGNVIVRVQASV